jgi:hypothetical protein
VTPEQLAEHCRLADLNFTCLHHEGIPMASLMARYIAKHGVSIHTDPARMRESAAFLEGLAQTEPGTPQTPAQKRFADARFQLRRAAQLFEMANNE